LRGILFTGCTHGGSRGSSNFLAGGSGNTHVSYSPVMLMHYDGS